MIYFDNAATTFPKPSSVIREVSKCMAEYCGNPGRGSHPLAVAASEKLYECREIAAELFGASPENVVFTYNTTYALNMALAAYIPKGSHLIISDLEHNAVLRPITRMKDLGYVTYDVFTTKGSPAQVIENIRSKVRQNTKAVVCTLASNICSSVIPAAEIGAFCKRRGILFIADGAQAAGHREINMDSMGIDVLCLPGHKGLYGPQGTGMMIADVKRLGEPFISGGSGFDSKNTYMPEIMPDRYEAGTANTPGIAGLAAGMDFVRRTGLGQIKAAEDELWNRLYSKLASDKRFAVYGQHVPSSVMLINKRGRDTAELSRELVKKGICTRSGLHCAPLAHKTVGTGDGGGVRISFGVFNTVKEVDYLCDVLYRV